MELVTLSAIGVSQNKFVKNWPDTWSLATLSAIGKSMKFGHSECDRQIYGVWPL